MITADIKTIDARHSGQFIANILFDAQQIQSLGSWCFKYYERYINCFRATCFRYVLPEIGN